MSLGLECPTKEELQAFMLGKVADANSARIKDHLTDCAGCRTVCEELSFDTLATPASFSSVEPDPTMAIRKAVPKEDSYSYLLPPVEPDELGRLGNYRVLHVLGRGGMGVVFRAEDIGLRRPVALKVMRPEMQGNRDGWDRFVREARTMAAIKHDNLVTIYQAGKEGTVVYFAMELLEGQSLDDWRKRQPAPDATEIVRIGLQIAKGLAFIHRKGLIHRDIKPANIWLEAPDQRVKILDLGLVLPVDADAKLTATGMVMGTPEFMAPEQARGSTVDARTDLFSLGGVLYYLCTGRKPFQGHTTSAVLMALASETPPSVSSLNPAIPEPLSDLVMELLARNPDERPASADEVIHRLETLEDVQIRQLSPTQRVKPKSAVKAAPAEPQESIAPAPAPQKSSGAWVKGLLIFALVALVSGGVFSLVQPFLLPQPRPKNNPVVPEAEKVYLSGLENIARENWPFRMGPPDDKGFKKKGPKGKEGKEQLDMTVRYHGIVLPRSIFMHPPAEPDIGAPASLTFSLRKQYRTFQAEVSLNDQQESMEAPCIFRVHGDGKLLWQSEPVWNQDNTQNCVVAVDGIDQLKISVTCAGRPFGAHAIWIDPFLVK